MHLLRLDGVWPVKSPERKLFSVQRPRGLTRKYRNSSRQGCAMHVVLADDHDLIREGLRAHVQALAEHTVITEAASCAQVLALVKNTPAPDLILLDLNMPGMNLDGPSLGCEGIS